MYLSTLSVHSMSEVLLCNSATSGIFLFFSQRHDLNPGQLGPEARMLTTMLSYPLIRQDLSHLQVIIDPVEFGVKLGRVAPKDVDHLSLQLEDALHITGRAVDFAPDEVRSQHHGPQYHRNFYLGVHFLDFSSHRSRRTKNVTKMFIRDAEDSSLTSSKAASGQVPFTGFCLEKKNKKCSNICF